MVATARHAFIRTIRLSISYMDHAEAGRKEASRAMRAPSFGSEQDPPQEPPPGQYSWEAASVQRMAEQVATRLQQMWG